MNDLSDYLDFIESDFQCTGTSLQDVDRLLAQVCFFNPASDLAEIDKFDVAVLGVADERGSDNSGTELAPLKIRAYLYGLAHIPGLKIVDLGNVKRGSEFGDALSVLELVCDRFIDRPITIVIIGGAQLFSYPVFKSFSNRGKKLNFVTVDPRLDLDETAPTLSEHNYIGKILLDSGNSLFNITNIGYQNYLNSERSKKIIDDFLFDVIRLGNAQESIKKLEPVFRDAHICSVDITSVRQSDAPGNVRPSPNGFWGNEVCQMSRYAGMGSNLQVFGLFGVNPLFDINNQTVNLSGQIIWHFFEGVSQKGREFPIVAGEKYRKYIVQVEHIDGGIVFWKNKNNERWWIELSYVSGFQQTTDWFACRHEDYLLACNNEIPDIWWRTMQRLKRGL